MIPRFTLEINGSVLNVCFNNNVSHELQLWLNHKLYDAFYNAPMVVRPIEDYITQLLHSLANIRILYCDYDAVWKLRGKLIEWRGPSE